MKNDTCPGATLNALIGSWMESGYICDTSALGVLDGVLIGAYLAAHHPEYLAAIVKEQDEAEKADLGSTGFSWQKNILAVFLEPFVAAHPIHATDELGEYARAEYGAARAGGE